MIPHAYVERFFDALDKLVGSVDTFATAYAKRVERELNPMRSTGPGLRPATVTPLHERCPVMNIEGGQRLSCIKKQGHDGEHEFKDL